jgi:glutaconyl-CoA/methylmalonyl-CoA decarboxylase subunit gamma
VPTFDVSIQGKSYRVEIPDPGACPLRVIVDGEPFDVAIAGTGVQARPLAPEAPPPVSAPPRLAAVPPAGLTPRPGPALDVAGNGVEVRAPMPGTILTVHVTIGQQVAAEEVLCVLEAMKMKNPIRAMRSGMVTEVAVAAGQSVAHNALLLKLS